MAGLSLIRLPRSGDAKKFVAIPVFMASLGKLCAIYFT